MLLLFHHICSHCHNRLDGLLVGLALGVVLALVHLVAQGILGSGGTSANGGIGVLGDLLVGLLLSAAGGLLDLLGNVVGALLDGIHCVDLVWFGLKIELI